MPKIISASKDSIIQVTKNIIKDGNYDQLNCRSIAKNAGIGLGTIYHFFKSKNEILAYIILDDWKNQLDSININCTIESGIKNIYEGLKTFSHKYYSLWEYTKKLSNEYTSYLSKHSILVRQVSVLLVKLLKNNCVIWEDDEIDFLSEAILTYSSRLYDYSRMEKIFIKLIGGNKNG